MERAVSLKKAVAAYEGYSELARQLHVPLSTCHGWASRGIPDWRQDAIRKIAKRDGFDVLEPPRKRRDPRRKKQH